MDESARSAASACDYGSEASQPTTRALHVPFMASTNGPSRLTMDNRNRCSVALSCPHQVVSQAHDQAPVPPPDLGFRMTPGAAVVFGWVLPARLRWSWNSACRNW
ncbi:MAG: hypothetical protein QOJ58_5012 [Alphaproteobacteria bacterium]|nr:hypothetical protein [Alphaproteobacteria bacterium]